jgi:hypothetical protein
MVDYYKIVQRSVAALNPDTEATRQALYERARAALAKQLCLKTPPLPNDRIRAELAALEDAIKQVESEAWSDQYEIKDKKEFAGAGTERTRPKRNATLRIIWSALLLAAGAAYFIFWMRSSGYGSITALVLLLVFALPAAAVFVSAIYPILSPLLRLLRWISKKMLQRLVGGEMAANAAGATILSATLCAIGAYQAPDLFSWWAAGWCWLGFVFLLTLDPGMVAAFRARLGRMQRAKAAPATGAKRPSIKRFLRWGPARKLEQPDPEKGLSKAA